MLRGLIIVAGVLVAGSVQAEGVIANPYAPTRRAVVVDFSQGKLVERSVAGVAEFHALDAFRGRPVEVHAQGELPAGWVQRGGVVVPQAVADGADVRGSIDDITDDGRPSLADKVIGPDASTLCEFPEQVPGGIYTGKFVRGSEYPRHGTIYMNFTGGTMYSGGENSAENTSTLAKNNSTYPVYTGGEEKAVAVAQAVQNDYADMAVRVVYLQRPPKLLPYAMVMMGGSYTDTTAGPSGGVAPGADCEDLGMRNVCYAFVNSSPINAQANTASQELGHTMGLGHTFGSDRVMAFGYDTNASIDMGFGDECTAVLTAQGQSGYCAGVNKCHCASDGMQQHDKHTLKAIYAAPGPDMVAPTITITAPADGTSYAPGETITVEVLPEDDFGGYGWQLTVIDAGTDEELGVVVDYQAAQEFKLGGLPAGTYRLVARVQDHADQIGEHTITVTVEGAAGAEDTGEVPTTGEADDTGASSSESGEASSGSSGGIPEDSVDDGCNCGAAGGGSGGLVLGLIGFGRRRRRCSSN